ncbi:MULTISPECIES: hypothetical protein [Metallosphaera]|nr:MULTISPECIES: hypothetical protein [Metallosphaera]MCY0861958.1 hypothetical protein [Metallosphaera prunae]WPX05235.1 hypothetical protein SOJ17_001197 [Metallosphaera sedula DSM 5348]BBL47321.1 hypothetical protein MJ1HA_1422 [Metallosphaera sedula]
MRLNPVQTQLVIKLAMMGAAATALLLASHGVIIHAGISTGNLGGG